jgi:hypothetical protein
MRITIIIILIIIGLLYFYSKKEGFETDDWKSKARNINLYDNMMEAELQTDNGEWVYNRIEIHPVLQHQTLINDNGSFKYKINSQYEDEKIMNEMFPIYQGETIPKLTIDKCMILSVDLPKYVQSRQKTMAILDEYTLPPTEIYYGYTPDTISKSDFYPFLNPDINKQSGLIAGLMATSGMLEIFDKFSQTYPNGWLLYFEDDVRPLMKKGSDLTVLYNVPKDAELIRPYVGKNEPVDIKDIHYRHSYSGGMNHAFYLSSSACHKIIKYAKTQIWKNACDIDLYKLAKGCGQYPTGLDSWSLHSSGNKNDISPAIKEEDKIRMYHTSHILFDQISNPITPAYQSSESFILGAK